MAKVEFNYNDNKLLLVIKQLLEEILRLFEEKFGTFLDNQQNQNPGP